ncbi:MAG: DNA gyrase subunit A, partial [Opitutales bacterium]|nr:DNA gyrase subunit A [Opitutales bacterium]
LIGSETHNEDFIEYLFSAKTHDTIMFFTNKGRVYVQKAYEIPEGSRTSKGRSIVNVIEMQEGEKLATLLCIPEFTDTKNVFFCTKNGVVKKTTLSEYKNCNRRGIIAINLREGDDLISVKLTNGNDQVILITESGMTIRFDETDARNLGRSAAGVTGMKLREGDAVVAMEVVDPACTLLIAGKNGIGKRTQYDDEEGEVFRKQNRGGIGVIGIKNKSGVAGALSVLDSDQVMLLTKGGQAIRMPVKGIRRTGRAAQGVKLMDIDTKAGEEVIGICKVITGDDESDATTSIPTAG